MRRRNFISRLTGILTSAAPVSYLAAQRPIAEIQLGWEKLVNPSARVADTSRPLYRTDEEWKRRLTPGQYRVLRTEETEAPFSSPLNDETRAGAYVCAGCNLPVFTSAMKFDAGTGWPSFFTSIPASFIFTRSTMSVFTGVEYHCRRCGGHHGHLFRDGPEPTLERWCNNGVALRFFPLEN